MSVQDQDSIPIGSVWRLKPEFTPGALKNPSDEWAIVVMILGDGKRFPAERTYEFLSLYPEHTADTWSIFYRSVFTQHFDRIV